MSAILTLLAQSEIASTPAVWGAAAQAGICGVLLLAAVLWFASREKKRDATDREDRTLLVTTVTESKTAVVEARKAAENVDDRLEKLENALTRLVTVLEKR